MRSIKLAVGAALVVAAVGAPTGASATIGQCLSNKMCAWGNNDFNWLLAAQIHGQGPGFLDVFNNGAGENDETDSWANRSADYTGCLAANDDGTGDRLTMRKVSNDPNLAFFNSDEVSSMRTKGGC